MRIFRTIPITAAVIAAGAAPATAQPPSFTTRGLLDPGTLAITNVTVIPMHRDTVIRNATVTVRDGRIAEVRARGAAPRGARVIDGRGKFLIPGLADMHTHLFSDAGPVADSIAPAELAMMLANGVTTARLMIGAPSHVGLRKAVAEGSVLGPQLWIGSPHLSDIADENVAPANTPEEARAGVDRAADVGYDFIKVTFVSRPAYDAIIDQARARGIPVAGHADPRVGLERALQTGQELEHLDSFFEALLADSAPSRESVTQQGIYRNRAWPSLDHVDDRKIAPLAGAIARAGVAIGPTQNVFNTAFGIGESDSALRARPDWAVWPERLRQPYLNARARYWSPASLEVRTAARRQRYVDVRNRMVKALNDSGATIIAGSDTPEFFHVYGWGLHRELAAYVQAGLRPYDALRTATVNPAKFLGVAADWGTIEPGKRADLLLLEANPLDDITNTSRIDAVIVGGRVLTRDQRARLIEQGRQAVGATP